MSTFLVTGGAGFIGSHLVERLVNEGEKVRVIDNLSHGREENISHLLDKIELIRDDIRNFDAVKKAVEGVDYILHQAALCSVSKSIENPFEFNEVNINGTLNLLKASYQAKIKRFIFASSSAIYGQTDKFPETEDDVPNPISPYALTKLTGEYYCRIFSQVYGLETVCLRYFNVFGPRQPLDDEYAIVIPKFIASMLKDQPPPIHGTGKQSRDFIYVDNIVDSNILVANAPNIKYEIFNIATGQDISILELVNILNKIMQKAIKPNFTSPREADIFRSQADISRAKKKLKYKPRVDFEEGLRRTIRWFQKR